MYEHVKTGCKHIPPSEQPLQFQSGHFLNKPRMLRGSVAIFFRGCLPWDWSCHFAYLRLQNFRSIPYIPSWL